MPRSWARLAMAALALGPVVACEKESSREAALPLPGGVTAPKAAPVAGPRFSRANVLVVSIDTLRRDHLAPYGASFETPAASRLAREGVVFEHAVSHVPVTLPSHSSMFTGL